CTGPSGGPRPMRIARLTYAYRQEPRRSTATTTRRSSAMRNSTVLDLADCTEFRQALQARPPAVVHGTAALLALLLGTALGWAALTRADLVVRGTGRIRPVTTPVKVYNPVRGESLSSTAGGRVVEVHARQGDTVRQGDVLVRLETGRLDNEIARQRRLIRAGEGGVARLEALEEGRARR